jgi:hypothetical protein
MRWNRDEWVVVEVRKRERSGCEKRRRICVTGEEAENGPQRTVRQRQQIRNSEEYREDQQKG